MIRRRGYLALCTFPMHHPLLCQLDTGHPDHHVLFPVGEWLQDASPEACALARLAHHRMFVLQLTRQREPEKTRGLNAPFQHGVPSKKKTL